MTAVGWSIVGFIGVGAVGVAVYYIREVVLNSIALGQRDAALEVEQQRIAAEERAKDAARAIRAEEFQHEKAAAVSAADAARLLQQAADGTQAD